MTNTRRGTTARNCSAPSIQARKPKRFAVALPERLHTTTSENTSQGGSRYRSSTLRLVLFSNTKSELPEKLRGEVSKHDRDAPVKRNWNSVIDSLDSYDVIVDYSENIHETLRRINEISRHRVRKNYAIRPAYLAISTTSQHRAGRFEVERLGERFLHLADVPSHFGEELEQIRLRIAALERSTPRWLIVYERNGRNMRVSVSFLGPRGWHILRQDDRQAAEFAVLIKNNGIPRSIAAWREIMIDDLLFKPAGGGFSVPSRTTLRMHIHRDYIRDLQRAFDEARSGYCAARILERVKLGEKTVGYRIKGRWEAVRR